MEHEGRSLVLYFLFIFSVGYVYSENIATGTTYTFNPTIREKIENFDWRHNGNLVVEWDPDNGAHWYRYRERAHINSDTGDLTLQVKKEDNGVFRGQFQVKGVLQYFERTITVIGGANGGGGNGGAIAGGIFGFLFLAAIAVAAYFGIKKKVCMSAASPDGQPGK
ncbi:hypothetical protein PGIGA_G00215750 [Pangasianodon gigas]|uniref:Uncharacterized protein n=1 Tax=Pangasianodon gigas TaxID=30993 RepID=A0ACC5WH90_PANGG|nr:hypothetical protein [Pangasianodon gigas]